MYVSELLPVQTKQGGVFLRCKLGTSPDLGLWDRLGPWKQPGEANVSDC